MFDNQVSLTAIMTAYCRAYHAMNDNPKIFDDFLAYSLIPEERRNLIEQGFAMALKPNSAVSTNLGCNQQVTMTSLMQAMGLPNVVSRARYTEDNLRQALEQGIKQYVILGAGLDTFAFRRADMLEKLRVFEVDHPATQTFKCNRLTELEWPAPNNLHFVAADFTKTSLDEALKESSFDPEIKSFFSWLGVTMYLTREEVISTLQSIVKIAPTGSIIVFDYFMPEKANSQVQEIWKELRKIGEPVKTGFIPEVLVKDLKGIGLKVLQDMGQSDIQKHYFQDHSDCYHASKHVHLAMAEVK